MANTVIALRSSGATGNVPSLGSLEYGEFALNYADGILYYRTAGDLIGSIYKVEPSGLNQEIQFNDGGSFGANSALRFDKGLGKLYTGSLEANGNITAVTITASDNVIAEHAIVHQKLYAGIATIQATELPNVIAQFSSNAYTYTQVNQQNIDGHGSADFVITADVGDDLTFYTDVGMAGSQYNFYDGYDTPFEPLTGYFLVQGNTGQVGGNMVIGTTAESTNIRFLAGGFESANVVMEMDNDGVTSTKVLTAHNLISTHISTNVVSASGNVYGDNILANTKFYAGLATNLATPLPNLIAQFTGNTAGYTQVNQQNINPDGSADYVITADVGDDTNFFIDMGIQGSNLEQGTLKPLDGYLLVQGSTIGQIGGNLVIGTISETPGQETRIVAGGYNNENVIVRVTETGVHFNQEIYSNTTTRIYDTANLAYSKANSANILAQQAYDAANSALNSSSANYFPLGNYGLVSESIVAIQSDVHIIAGELDGAVYDCFDEPVTPQGTFLEIDFGYLA